MTPSLVGGGHVLASSGNDDCPLAGDFHDRLVICALPRCVGRRRPTSPCVARTEMCPSCVRVFLWQTTRNAYLQALCVSPLTDSNRRPPPYHGGFGASRASTCDHSRHTFSCKTHCCKRSRCVARRRACRFLMCPFCVRGWLLMRTTPTGLCAASLGESRKSCGPTGECAQADPAQSDA